MTPDLSLEERERRERAPERKNKCNRSDGEEEATTRINTKLTGEEDYVMPTSRSSSWRILHLV